MFAGEVALKALGNIVLLLKPSHLWEFSQFCRIFVTFMEVHVGTPIAGWFFENPANLDDLRLP